MNFQVSDSTQKSTVALNRVVYFEHAARNARITALVLSFVTLFLITLSCILFGLGSLSPTFMMGLGIFPFLGGALVSFVALGVLIGTLVFVALASVRSSQKEHWQGIWERTLPDPQEVNS